MNLTDIISLAKAGYKPSDIKDLISLADDKDIPKEDKPVEHPAEEAPEVTDEQNATEEPETKEPEIDYKARCAELEKKLKDAQKANVNKDVSNSKNEKTDFENLVDITSSFM